MMKFIDYLNNIWEHQISPIEYKEDFDSYVCRFPIPHDLVIDANKLLTIFSEIKDKIQISLLYLGTSEYTLISKENIQDLIKKKFELTEYIDHEDESSFEIELILSKQKSDDINIYDFNLFERWWTKLTLQEILKFLTKYGVNGLNFSILYDDLISFGTKYFKFNFQSEAHTYSNSSYINKIKNSTHFKDIQIFPFSPDYFYFEKRPTDSNQISRTFDILACFFSIGSIFNISYFNSDYTNFYFRLNGYKLIEGNLLLDDLKGIQEDDIKEYSKIFYWIYKGDSNVCDKLGIAQNILSMYITDDSLRLSKNVFTSIQSAFQTYLKENLDKYITIRNQIYLELDSLASKAADIKGGFIKSFKGNLVSFLSFFMSVFIINVLNEGSFEKIFTKDITVLSYSLLIVSILFLSFTRFEINKEVNELSELYIKIKNRYTNLLTEDDIKSIIGDDNEFKIQQNKIRNRIKEYSMLWCIVLVILFLSISYLSEWSVSILQKVISIF